MHPVDEMVYELECDSCGVSYELIVEGSEKNEPVYCAFCGSEMDIELDEDEEDYDDEYDELDFDDYRD